MCVQGPVTGTWGESYTYPQVPTPHIDLMGMGGGKFERKITRKVCVCVGGVILFF